MSSKISGNAAGLFLFFLSITCVFFTGTFAFAAGSEVNGCSPDVMRALEAKAQAQVAADVAATEQIIDKPESVLKLTCFNKQAGRSAKRAGEIFSNKDDASLIDDENFKKIIGSALRDSAADDATADAGSSDDPGADASALDVSSDSLDDAELGTTIEDDDTCDKMKEAWEKSEKEGIEAKAPYVSFDNMVNGTAPSGAGKDYTDSWNASKDDQSIFQELKDSAQHLKDTAATPLDFSASASSCDVLFKAGVVSDPCPASPAGGGP